MNGTHKPLSILPSTQPEGRALVSFMHGVGPHPHAGQTDAAPSALALYALGFGLSKETHADAHTRQ